VIKEVFFFKRGLEPEVNTLIIKTN